MQLGLITSIRDEAPYIIEWLAHHRALGFRQFLVYQNDSRDGTDDLLAALDAAGELTYRDNSSNRVYRRGALAKLPPVLRAYERARIGDIIQTCDYVLVSDVDEFLVLYQDDNLFSLLDRLDHPDAVSFAWRIFGDNGQTRFNPAPVADRFTQAAASDNAGGMRPYWQVKTLFRPPIAQSLKQHRPATRRGSDLRWLSADGADLMPGIRSSHQLDRPALGYASLHHYHNKSLAEFCLKMFRGYGDRAPTRALRPGLQEFRWMNANDVPCPMPDALKQARNKEMARLRALPGVARAEAKALDRFETLLGRVKQAVEADPAAWRAPFIRDSDDLRALTEATLDGSPQPRPETEANR